MDTSVGKSSQYIETKGICILLANEDLTSYNIVAEMLQHCSCEVLRVGGALDVLNAISVTKDMLELVLTNAHKLVPHGIEIIQHIQKKINLPIVLMSPDKTKIASKGHSCSFAAYVLNGLSRNAVNNLWQFALEKEKAKMVAANQEGNGIRAPSADNADDTNKSSDRNCKKKRSMEKSEGNMEDSHMEKKPRVVWTPEMHQKFLEAIKIIGYEKAVPKKIVEVMSIPGLTRENVASHLQKFRGGLKRAQELALTSLSGSNIPDEFKASFVSPPHSTSTQNSFKRIPYFAQENYSTKSLQQNYLNMQNKFSLSRNNYTNSGSIQFSGDQRGVNNLQQKYVPKFQLNRNFRIYGDQTKNMLLSVKKSGPSSDSNRSNSGMFVGYRLTNDGNSIEFGNKETSVNDEISRETQFSTPGNAENQFNSYIPHNPISPLLSMGESRGETSFQFASVSEIPGDESSAECMTMPVENLPDDLFALLRILNPATENQVKIPSPSLNSISQEQLFVQSLETSGNEYNYALTDQYPSLKSTEIPITNEIPVHKLHGNETPSQDSSIHCQGSSPQQLLKALADENVEKTESEFVPEQDFSLPQLDTYENYVVTFSEGIPPQHSSPSTVPQMQQEYNMFLDQEGIDDVLLNGTGNTCPQFDWDEFEDTLFNHGS